VQAIGLPSLPAQGGRFVVLSLAAMAACLATGATLAAAGRSVWRVVAAVAAVLLVGWALPRVVTVPGLEATRGDWSSLPGAVCAALAGTCLVAAGLAGQLPRPPARALATALALLTVSAPGVWALLVALGPGPAGGEGSLAAAHVHGHVHAVVDEQAIQFRPGPKGGHYVIAVPAPPRRPPLELELVVAAALLFACGAVRHLGRRSGLAGRPA
jgi:hypothetical protein